MVIWLDDKKKTQQLMQNTFVNKQPHKKVDAAQDKKLNTMKIPSYDLITRDQSDIGYATLKTDHFPNIWKVVKIIMVLKTGKDPNKVSLYRLTSVLPICSKLFENT